MDRRMGRLGEAREFPALQPTTVSPAHQSESLMLQRRLRPGDLIVQGHRQLLDGADPSGESQAKAHSHLAASHCSYCLQQTPGAKGEH